MKQITRLPWLHLLSSYEQTLVGDTSLTDGCLSDQSFQIPRSSQTSSQYRCVYDLSQGSHHLHWKRKYPMSSQCSLLERTFCNEQIQKEWYFGHWQELSTVMTVPACRVLYFGLPIWQYHHRHTNKLSHMSPLYLILGKSLSKSLYLPISTSAAVCCYRNYRYNQLEPSGSCCHCGPCQSSWPCSCKHCHPHFCGWPLLALSWILHQVCSLWRYRSAQFLQTAWNRQSSMHNTSNTPTVGPHCHGRQD